MSESSMKKVVTNSVIYTISGLMLKCFSVLLLPLYTVYLTAEDYGITSIAGSFETTMGFVITLSLFAAVTRFYVEYKDDPKKLSRFYGTVVVFSLLSSIAAGIVLTIFRNPLSKYVFSGVDYYPVIFICLLGLVFNVQHTIYIRVLQSQQKAFKCSVLTVLFFFINLALNIVFVVVFKKGTVGVLTSALIANVAFFVFFMVDMIKSRSITFCIDLELLKESLKYSVPIIPHNLSTQIAMLISKAIIGGSASLAELGLYSVAAQFGNMSDTIQTYVNSAYAPWLYERLHSKQDDYKKNIRSVVNLLAAVIGLLLLGIALFAQDYILLFLDKSYATAWRFVPLITLVFAIKTMYYFYVNVLFYYKKASRLLFTATVSSSLINTLLAAILIPKMGAYGTILADGISMVIRVAIITAISIRFENIGLRISDFILNFFTVAVFVLGGHALSYLKYHETFSILNFGYKVLVTLIYVAIVFLRYRNQITVFVRSFMNKKKKRR